MRTVAFALIVALLPLTAQAQTSFQTVTDAAVGNHMRSFRAGAGAPTVTFDDNRGAFLMFFETRVAARGCDEAWAIGSATSVDGVQWQATGIVLPPVPGTDHSCGARYPAIVDGPDGAVLYFNAQSAVRDDRIGAWKLGQSLRHAQVLPELDGLREPSVAHYDGEFVMLAVRDDPSDQAVVTARSVDGASWSVDDDDAIAMGATPWSAHGTMSPTLLCNDVASYPFEVYYGGWTASDTGWTWGVSNDASKWYVAAPITVWSDDSAWISWDAVKIGAETLLVFEALGDDGVPRVGVAATSATWDPTDARPRRCVNPNSP